MDDEWRLEWFTATLYLIRWELHGRICDFSRLVVKQDRLLMKISEIIGDLYIYKRMEKSLQQELNSNTRTYTNLQNPQINLYCGNRAWKSHHPSFIDRRFAFLQETSLRVLSLLAICSPTHDFSVSSCRSVYQSQTVFMLWDLLDLSKGFPDTKQICSTLTCGQCNKNLSVSREH